MSTEKKRSVRGLRDIMIHKDGALRDIQDECTKFYRAAMQDAEAKIRLYVKVLFLTRQQNAEQEYEQALAELHTEQERMALLGEGAPYPLGTKMVGQRQKSRFDPATTVYGVVEAITRDSVHDEKRQQYRKAPIGDFVVRHLLATGKPAKTYDTSFHEWKPVDSTVQRNEAFFAPKNIKI
jgi:hypothetical protein